MCCTLADFDHALGECMHVDRAMEEGQSMLVTNKDAAILEELLRTFKLVDLKIAGIWTKPQQEQTR